MAAAQGAASSPFELKSASLSVVALMLRTGDVPTLSVAMAAQFGDMPGLFDHDPVIIDLASLERGEPPVDFDALCAMLRRQRLLPVAVRGGSDAQMAAALRAGLGATVADAPGPSAASVPTSTPSPVPLSPSASTPAADPVASATHADAAPASTAAEAPAATAPVAADAPLTTLTTLTIDKPLRSGQQVYAKGGDLIVLAAVNFGAEVLADGNIHVYGPLRGKAIAGAKGDAGARIFSTCMEPELVAIAGTYRTTENPLPAEVVGKPAQIRLLGERLVFEPLS